MTLPLEITEPLKQLPPILRILLVCLLIAVMSLTSAVVYMNRSSSNRYERELKDCNSELKEARDENKTLIYSENERLRAREKWSDSNIQKTNTKDSLK